MPSRKHQAKPSRAVRKAPGAELLSPVTLGIAHDLNNHLTGVLSLSDLSLREAGPNSPLKKHLETIYSSGERAAQLVRRLYLEHQAQLGQPGLHDLNALVRSAFELVHWALKKSVETSLNLCSDPLPVQLDAVGFRNAILRVALTAAESGATTLEIRTSMQANAGERTSAKRTAAHAARWAACAIRASASIGKGKQRQGLELAEQFALSVGGILKLETDHQGRTTITLCLPQAELD